MSQFLNLCFDFFWEILNSAEKLQARLLVKKSKQRCKNSKAETFSKIPNSEFPKVE